MRGAERSPATWLLLAAGLVGWLFAAAATAAEPATAPSSVRWTLAEVVATALANHPAVGIADAEARAAAARAGQVRSVTLPQVGAQAGWSWSENPSPGTGEQVTSGSAAVQGTASQLILDFGRTSSSISRAADLAAAAIEGGRASRVDIAWAAEVAYFDVLRAGNLLDVARETVRQRESLLKQAQAFYETGLKARIDVVRAEANLYQARADVTAAEHAVRIARLVLLSRMGVDGPGDFELAEAPAFAAVSGDLAAWAREAEENHPDLRSLRLRQSAATSGLRAARLGDAPSLGANGHLGWAGDDWPLDRTWSLGLQVNVPIFNGRLTKEQSSEAEAELAAATFSLEEGRRQIQLALQQAAQSIANAEDQLQARQKEREAFAENLRLATGRYEAGAGDIIEMIDAQVQMARAETNVVGARFDRAVAVATLYRAVGRLPQL